MYACICREITEAQVKDLGRTGIVAPSALIEVLGLQRGNCCGRCVTRTDKFVGLAWAGAAEVEASPIGSARRQTQASLA